MKILLQIILFFIVQTAISQSTVKRLDGSTISDKDLTHAISQIVESAKIAGLSMLVINDNKIVYEGYFGTKDKRTNQKPDTETIFYAASFTKPLFTYTFLKLVDHKIFDLDKPIHFYLKKPISEYPKWKDLANEKDFDKITPRMILSHSSGLPSIRDSILKLKAKPAEKFYYSNEGMNLLGFVTSEYLGKKLEDIVKDSVLDPLNMKRTAMVWNKSFEDNYAYGYNSKGESEGAQKRESARAAGSMVTTVHDYAQFMMAVLEQKGLSKKLFKAMLKPQIIIKSLRGFGPAKDTITTKNDVIHLGWGLGWGIFQTNAGKAFFHSGNIDGWKNYCVAYPEKKMAIIILSNSDNADPQFGKIVNAAIKDTQSPLEWLGCYDN